MKHIKTYETRITQKSLLNAINDFIVKALPPKFTVKIYNGTINIKESNIRNTVGYYFISFSDESFFDKKTYSIHLGSRTLEGSNSYLIVEYIINKLKNSNIPTKIISSEEKKTNYTSQNRCGYDKYSVVSFTIKYFENIISFFNTLPTDELETFLLSNKYNI